MKCYNKNCLYNIRKEEECGLKETEYEYLYIDSEGKCGKEDPGK